MKHAIVSSDYNLISYCIYSSSKKFKMTTFLMNYYSVLEMLNCQELVVGLIITHVILYYNNILLLLYDINYNITNLNQKVHVKYYYFSKY